MQIIDVPASARILMAIADGQNSPSDTYVIMPIELHDELLAGHLLAAEDESRAA